jgi:hypothetical protein
LSSGNHDEGLFVIQGKFEDKFNLEEVEAEIWEELNAFMKSEIPTEELEKVKEKGRMNYADTIIDDLIGNIYSELENYGLELDGEGFDKDFSFAMDGLRACVYRVLGVKHHLHNFLDENVTMKQLKDIRMELENEAAKMDIEVSSEESGLDEDDIN